MKITRKEALELMDVILEQTIMQGYQYWIHFKHRCIPYNICMKTLRQFIENPALIEVDLSGVLI